ncbi:ATP-binding protein [Micromonospora sp. PLK6-60]|uniref:sensor histidine kinase n=1 Tax=Micromonospora sp. PLK6-60 TaxID=2873383 RepID=UPI001CA7224B|nr:ATP-binding protein [Micromonospora sp. PLK6-60]MBY8873291.1 ATP-binding protein [Micromonospora sp. PLK6-60]
MSAVAVPTTPPAGHDRPAGSAFGLVFTTLPALLRLTCGLVGAVVALAVRTPPVRVSLLLPAVVLLTAWSVLYAVRAVRHGIGPALVAGDVALSTAACLLIPWLVAPEVLPGEGSWVAVLASATVINTQATAPARWSVPAGVLVTAAYTAGAYAAGNPAEGRAHAVTLLAQTACTAMMTGVMRRRIGRADRAFADYQRVSREALVARTAREAERRHNRDLHDTVLATLTMVGLGAVPPGSATLRARCATDLRTLAALAEARSAPGDAPVRVDDRLRAVLAGHPELAVHADLAPGAVPGPVAEALAAGVAAALSNVARHAPGASVTLRLAPAGGGVVVELADDGPGFDPSAVPAHRYGLRESVRGRMATIGGRATIGSAPGAGTRIRLEWPDVH